MFVGRSRFGLPPLQGAASSVSDIGPTVVVFAAESTAPYTAAVRFEPLLVALSLSSLSGVAQQTAEQPIIDMHLHAFEAGPLGGGCVPLDSFPAWDAKLSAKYNFGKLGCLDPLTSPKTSDELMNETLAVLDKFNITALARPRCD